MIDISDGLSSDLRHITEASGAGAVIFEEKLPVSRELAAYAGRERAIKLSLSGGEDYELLFTVRGPERGTRAFRAWQESRGNVYENRGGAEGRPGVP